MNLYTPSAHLCAALLACLLACGDRGTATTAASDTGTAPTEPATTTTTSTSTSTSTTTSTSATSTPATDTSATSTSASDTGSFALMPDLPPPVACDAYHDTCPPGQKCKPYGGATESACVDVIDDPVGVGEPCTSAIDSLTDECEAGTVCYSSGQADGRCLALCEGSADDATCADSCSTCVRPGGGMFGVCPVLCDPRAPACPEHLSCVISQHDPSFFCVAHDQGSLGAGEVCSSLFDCQEGMACMEAPFLPGCADTSCCTPVCDLNQADTCESTYPGSVCNPWPTWNPDLNERCLLPGLGLCGAPP